MTFLENVLAVQLDQPYHLVFNQNPVTGTFLKMVPWILSPRIGTQVEDAGKNRQAMAFNGAPDIAGHASRHGDMGAVGGLKFGMDQHLLAADTYAKGAVGAGGLRGWLLVVE